MSAELRRSWLVQRLKKPAGTGSLAALGEAFSFGGGRVNGGLSKEAMSLLRQVFSFDYMGSSEFEWGAVPEALSCLANDEEHLTAFQFTIPLAKVGPNWRTKKDDPKPTGDRTVFVLCRQRQEAAVVDRITEWATGREDLKEWTNLPAALRPYDEWDSGVCGWLELDNGFFFFTDEQMWHRTAELFGVGVEATS